MLNQVENKLQELNKKKAEQYYKKKESDLEIWGLTAKKGEPPIIVSDEEYDALVKASNGLSSRNGVAVLLNIVSIVTIIFSIIGAFLFYVLSAENGFFYSVLIVICGIIFATILGGLAEAVKLLQQLIDDKPIDVPNEFKHKQQPQQPVMYQPPVYQQPVYQTPVYQPPVFTQPPVYQQQYQAPQQTQPQQQPSQTIPGLDLDDIYESDSFGI
ncbi:MAG: hypothetical protein IJW86_10910 [Clostridia bacterium]|nr:hypothetical protein [Clostridia bacterium]MBQ7296681.1 hypothetical protein [Clostridia bacterium]